MSYAAVASHNTSGYQPTADQSLLNTEQPHASNIADDSAKVGVVSHDFKEHPETITSQHTEEETIPSAIPSQTTPAPRKEKKMPSKPLDEARAEGLYLWELTKHALLRPGVAGGLVGLGMYLQWSLSASRSCTFPVNIGLLAGAGRAFYAQPDLRRNTTVISSVVAGTIALLSVEGFAAEKYRQTPSGREEERRAKEEGTLIYKHVREIVLRPGVLGGLVGLSKSLSALQKVFLTVLVVNAGILGTVGYFSYINWDRPTWDRRTVSAVSVGLLALWGGEGYASICT